MKIKKDELNGWINYFTEKAEKDAYDAYENILKYDDNLLLTDDLYIDRDFLIKKLGKYYIEPKINFFNKNNLYYILVEKYYQHFCNNIIYYYNNFDN